MPTKQRYCPTSTGLWQRRHDEICTELARWLNRWNFLDIKQEPQNYFENYRLRPDIIATHPRTFQVFALDVTVTSPLQDKYLARSCCENGYAAKRAEQWKLAHYKEAMSVEKPNDKFIPIAIESFGRTGQLTQEFLQDSCKHLLHRTAELSDVRAQMNRKLWQGNAEIAIGALRVDQLANPLVPVFSFERSMRPR
uniref:Uncharacterized protein n=1 Tax=Rhodosorus marinus TaxID=101924 RepID=A0A7S3E6T6_9RHOD|mmetsp:Transcript_13582/g.54444  ORF Transcript_13582/g.54444 Transcript_13582/m.54444 type:complete len:195 (+) Transcript_13582:30-614(+)